VQILTEVLALEGVGADMIDVRDDHCVSPQVVRSSSRVIACEPVRFRPFPDFFQMFRQTGIQVSD
jgi:hypothetical protein